MQAIIVVVVRRVFGWLVVRLFCASRSFSITSSTLQFSLPWWGEGGWVSTTPQLFLPWCDLHHRRWLLLRLRHRLLFKGGCVNVCTLNGKKRINEPGGPHTPLFLPSLPIYGRLLNRHNRVFDHPSFLSQRSTGYPPRLWEDRSQRRASPPLDRMFAHPRGPPFALGVWVGGGIDSKTIPTFPSAPSSGYAAHEQSPTPLVPADRTPN